MTNEAYQFQSNGLAQFAQMIPQGGFTGCGDDLYVLVTDLGSGTVTSTAPDQPLNQTINTTNSMYEIAVKSAYNVGPLVSLATVPILGNIPGLGQPVTLSFTANRPVEHPGGLQAAANSARGPVVQPFARVAASPAVPGIPTPVTWRTPGIFHQIAQAGQTVVSVNVVMVPADNGGLATSAHIDPPWTQSGINIQSGQNVWVDTQSVGTWGVTLIPLGMSQNVGPADANGVVYYQGGAGYTAYWFTNISIHSPVVKLLGFVGPSPCTPAPRTVAHCRQPESFHGR